MGKTAALKLEEGPPLLSRDGLSQAECSKAPAQNFTVAVTKADGPVMGNTRLSK